ncbi:terpene synthase metal binding domain-containing protein [Hypoxylon trugodes]|uniref:terpene synthase metal binding domain-containing protein n=1 Tax=Hypoxylon trugodes TaxID=326681 RepID=UPI002192093A|nr:terpene synthase metal binding domain-containing protein [Hypoxylon trugodes]KAI1393511.1 terpene synthase metal binding domain-containing protein [Hypoxylon trugodes]
MSLTSFDSVDRRVIISLPDMFKGFLVSEPVLNPYYTTVRPESENWLQRIMSLTPKQHKRVNYCDFSYFCAVLVPLASQERLKIVSDWGNWVFLFDDMFDEGELTDDPDTSQRIINNLLSAMLPDVKRLSEEPVVKAHDSIYRRFAAGSPPSVVKRYVDAMRSYCAGALQHVEDHAADRNPTIVEMLDTRRMSIGVFPMYPLIEFAYELDIPDEVFEHHTIQTLENLGAEFVMLMNDILSYRKEEGENCPFNMVAVCRMNGLSAQEAFDEIASMVDMRFLLWDDAVKSLPSWGENIDGQVRQYIQGIQNIVQANLSWSFRTGRYFGPKADEVRKSREIDVLMQPSFLTLQRIAV